MSRLAAPAPRLIQPLSLFPAWWICLQGPLSRCPFVFGHLGLFYPPVGGATSPLHLRGHCSFIGPLVLWFSAWSCDPEVSWQPP